METRKRKDEIEQLEHEVEELRLLSGGEDATEAELARLRREVSELKKEFYAHLGAWQRTQLARHPQRPYTLDYIPLIFESFSEIQGDRAFADDPAIVCGMARFSGRAVMVIGHQKGRDTKQKVLRNFGMPKPEGYRKALRVMQLAAKYNRPVLTFVDTPGAYPGLDAEERGQAEAIARNLREMAVLPVPIIVTVTGEGGSGGALAIAVGDHVQMMENSIYSVISPEGCASIMWRDASKAELAADALKITATDMLKMGLVDEIVPEPDGGAHVDPEGAAALLAPTLERRLNELSAFPVETLLERRYQKFRKMGQAFRELQAAASGD